MLEEWKVVHMHVILTIIVNQCSFLDWKYTPHSLWGRDKYTKYKSHSFIYLILKSILQHVNKLLFVKDETAWNNDATELKFLGNVNYAV